VGYNAVLCNLYRNGNDSVRLHADAEPEMGPIIASISLGAKRLFSSQKTRCDHCLQGTVARWESTHHGGRDPKELQARSPKRTEGGGVLLEATLN
jgi:alkylated DNA repair dioxygenase AlkB